MRTMIRTAKLLVICSLGLLPAWAQEADTGEPGDQAGQKGITQQSTATTDAVALSGSIWAVIVGINYEGNPEIGDLQYAESDADRFRQTLIEVSRGLVSETRTRVLTGSAETPASRLGVIRAVKAAADNAGPQDTILVYFSGHGVTDSGENYLVPLDGVPDLPADSAVGVDRIFQFLDGSAAARTVVFLDACHSGTVSSGAGVKDLAPRNAMSSTFADQVFGEGRGRIVLSSCDVDQVSLETAETGGVFTHYLCQGLRGSANLNGDGFITVTELANYVTGKVREWSFANNANMTPVLAGASIGEIPLVLVESETQLYAYAEPQRVDPDSLLVSRELSFDELQSQLTVQENLAQAKVILYGSREETSLNVEFRSDLKLPQLYDAIGMLDTYLSAYPDSAEGHRGLALAQWMAVGLEAAKPDGPEYFSLIDSRALPSVQRAIQLEPNNPRNYLLHAQMLVERQGFDAAIEEARQALALDANLVYAYAAWARAVGAKGQLGEALRVLQTAAQKFPDNPHVWKLMADVYLTRGQYTSAVGPLLTAEKLYEEVGTGYYAVLSSFLESLGYAFFWSDRDKAHLCFEQALETIVAHEEEELDNPYYHKFYGRLSSALNRPGDYRAGVMRAYAMDPEDAYVLLDRGVYYRIVGNETLAEQDIRAALALDDQIAYFWAELARTLEARDDLHGARAAWDHAVELAPEELNTLIERGGCLLKLGDQVGAEEDFHVALSVAPEDCDLLNQIALAHDKAGDLELAATYFTRARDAYEAAYGEKANPLYSYNIAVTLQKLGDLDAAGQELAAALEANPQFADGLNLAGDLAREREDYTGALDYYRQATDLKRALWHMEDLAELLTELDAEQAEATWDAMVAVYAEDAAAWRARGWHRYEQDRHEAAIADYGQALQLLPEDAETHTYWAYVLIAMDDLEGAEEHYRAALELDPSPSLYVDLIELLEGDPAREKDLETTWQEFLDVFPDDPEALVSNGDRLYDAGSYEAAAEAYARGAAVAPTDPRFENRQGNCLYALGLYRESIPHYEASLALKFDGVVVSNLAGAYEALGDTAGAGAVWEQHLGQHEDDADLRMGYGLSLYEAGDYAGALDQYQRGQRLEPENAQFFNRAGLCLFKLGQISAAIEQVKQALTLELDPLYYYNVAVGYEELEDLQSAERYYREGLELFPDHPDLLEGLGSLLRTQGREAEALEQLRAAAELTESVDVYAELAALADALGETALADSAYLDALRLEPGLGWLNVDYALFLAAAGSDSELLAHIDAARQRLDEGDYSWMVDELGAYWIDAGEFEHGADLMEELIGLNPAEPTAYAGLAMFQHLAGDSAAALATVKRGLNDAGDTYLARYLEVFLTNATKGAEIALPLAETLIDHPEVDRDAYSLYLDMLAETGNFVAQAAVGYQGLGVFPDNPDLLGRTALALYYSGDTAGCIALLEDIQYVALDYADRRAVLGYCYLEQGNYVKAAAHFTGGLDDDAENAQLWAGLGQAQYFMGELQSAREALTHALALDEYQSEANLWLAYVLLDQSDPAGAAVALAAVDTSPYSPALTLAWVSLARARIALALGDYEEVPELLEEADAYGAGVARFDAALAQTRKDAGF